MRLCLLPIALSLVACAEPLPPAAPTPPAAGAAPPGPPVAAVRPVTETHFGTTVADPYRWMEKLDAPETVEFLKGQAQYARRTLDALPQRKAIFDRITALDQGEALVLYARRQAGKLFYQKTPPGVEERDLFVKEGPVERKLLAVSSLTKG